MTTTFSTLSNFEKGAIVALFAFVLTACQKNPEKGGEERDADDEAVVDAALKEADTGWQPRVLGRAPEFDLIDQNGKRFQSERLAGAPWVANFMFTRCPTTCPRQTETLRSVQEKLRENPIPGGLQIISFSVDPTNDTPAALKAYAGKAGVDEKSWSFLTGTADEVLSSISEEGFKLALDIDASDPARVQHSPFLILVDAYNRIRGVYDSGESGVVDEVLAGLHALRSEMVMVPAGVEGSDWVEPRRQAQLNTADSIQAFHGFTFSDVRFTSGIRFRNKIVDDAGKTFKPAHYDHGTGIAIADVDGDDRLDIYFVTQVGGNELWRNLGGGEFENITGDSGLSLDDRVGVSASFADIDNDGDPDLFATSVRGGNKLFENLGGGKFKDITDEAGVGKELRHSSSAVFFDYDRDGLIDFLVTNVGSYTFSDRVKNFKQSIYGGSQGGYEFHTAYMDAFSGHLKSFRLEQSQLFRNLGGNKFREVTDEVGIGDTSWTGDAAAVDLNGDGWQDLYLLNMQGDDQIYLNRNGKTFVAVSRRMFPRTPWGSMGIKAFDFDNDDDLDIFITDMHSDMSQLVGTDLAAEKAKADMQWPKSLLNDGANSVFGNAFYRNEGQGSFQEVSDKIGAENYWPWGVSVDDVNADGYDDAFITASMNFPFRYSLNSLLLNEKGERFRDTEFLLGIEPRAGGFSTPWFEMDLAKESQDSSVLSVLESEGVDLGKDSSKVVVWSSRGTRSSAIFDIDDDGDLDIVTNEMNGFPMVLKSNLAERKNDLAFLKIKLVGTVSNRSGLGAIVRVKTDDLRLMKVKDGQSGYLSHSDMPLYFGLGGAEKVERITVDWPSGKKQTIEGPLEKNQLLLVVEEEAE